MDVSRLDLRSAFDFAVGNEEDSLLRYQELAARVSDPDAAKFFRFMAQAESKHQRQLESRRDVLFRHCAPRLDTSVVSYSFLPDPDRIDTALTVREALELALRAEIRSGQFYAAASAHVNDPDVRALFEELQDEEAQHEAEVRGFLEQLPPTPSSMDASGRG